MNLTDLGYKYGSDKAYAHRFTEFYQKHFEEIRLEPLNILEIGIDQGASLKMWEEYFPNARIYGIDIQSKLQFDTSRTITARGNQEDSVFLTDVFPGVSFNIIIDDGGHSIKQQLISLRTLFYRLKSGGKYVIEDLHTSYTQRQVVTVNGEEWVFNYGGHYGAPLDYTTLAVVENLVSHTPHNLNPYLPQDQFEYIHNHITKAELFRSPDQPTELKWERLYPTITSMLHKR